jgi:hypothetical protein
LFVDLSIFRADFFGGALLRVEEEASLSSEPMQLREEASLSSAEEADSPEEVCDCRHFLGGLIAAELSHSAEIDCFGIHFSSEIFFAKSSTFFSRVASWCSSRKGTGSDSGENLEGGISVIIHSKGA